MDRVSFSTNSITRGGGGGIATSAGTGIGGDTAPLIFESPLPPAARRESHHHRMSVASISSSTELPPTHTSSTAAAAAQPPVSPKIVSVRISREYTAAAAGGSGYTELPSESGAHQFRTGDDGSVLKYSAAAPTSYTYAWVVFAIGVVPIVETLIWLLVPLDAGMSGEDKAIHYANPYMCLIWYCVYGGFTITLLFYSNNYLGSVWEWSHGVPVIAIVFGCMSTCYALIFWLNGQNASNMLQIGMITSFSWGSIAHTWWRVWRKPLTDPHRAPQLQTMIALSIGNVVFSSLWVSLQFLSGMFTTSSIGENFFLLVGFGAAYLIAAQIWYWAERFIETDVYWEALSYFRFGITQLYYLYYRALFLTVPSWGEFAVYQSLHLVTEFGPVIQYSERYHCAFERVFGKHETSNDGSGSAALPACCGETMTVRDLLRRIFVTTNRVRYRERVLRSLVIKEWCRSYTIIALAIFMSFIREYRNNAYYPTFFAIDYERVMGYLGAMLASELVSTAIIYLLFRRLYDVHSFQFITTFKPGFGWGLVWLALHTSNDAFLSLMTARFH